MPDRAPWILTFSNHVRLVVGFIDDPDNPQLIVVDPSWSDVRGAKRPNTKSRKVSELCLARPCLRLGTKTHLESSRAGGP